MIASQFFVKYAYLIVPICQQHQEFLKFRWQGQAWQFQVLLFGLTSAPYMFTKLMKPVVSLLRKLGVRHVLYLDNMLIVAKTRAEARKHIATVVKILVALELQEECHYSNSGSRVPGFSAELPQNDYHLASTFSEEVSVEDTGERESESAGIGKDLGDGSSAPAAILPAPLHYRY